MENASKPNGVGNSTQDDLPLHTQQTIAMHNEYEDVLRLKKVIISGKCLTVGTFTAVSRNMNCVKVILDSSCKPGVDESVKCLQKHMNTHEIIYGVNTGFGASGDERPQDLKQNQVAILNHLNVAIRSHFLGYEISCGAVLARINSNISGYSGLRWTVIEMMSRLLNKGITPVLPSRGSLTASGDLIPLSCIASLLAGKHFSLAWKDGDVVDGISALKSVNEQPIVLEAKEGLAIVNGTSVATALAALVTYDSHFLFMLSEICTALTVEALNGSQENFHEIIHKTKPHPGQVGVAYNLHYLLQGSDYCQDMEWMEGRKPKLRQDRYSTRAAAQWLGPHVETLKHVTDSINIELNSVTDNPLIDYKNDEILHGANFMGCSMSQGMDHLRLSLQAVGRLAFAQFTKLVNKYYNNGLPPNLTTDDPSVEYGLKGLDTAMASYMSELQFLANPVQNCMNSAECDNQDLNSLGLISARYTTTAVEIVGQMLASHLYALCTAVDIRSLETLFITQVEESQKSSLNTNIDVSHPPRAKNLKYSKMTNDIIEHGVFNVIWAGDDYFKNSPHTSDFEKFDEIVANFRSLKFHHTAQETTAGRLGNTRAVHVFVRDTLKVPFADYTNHSSHIEKIYESIKTGRINSVLCSLHEENEK